MSFSTKKRVIESSNSSITEDPLSEADIESTHL